MLFRLAKLLVLLAFACLVTTSTAVIGSLRKPRGLEESSRSITITLPATAPAHAGRTLVFAGDNLGEGRLLGTRIYMGGIQDEEEGVWIGLGAERVGWPFACSEHLIIIDNITAQVLYEHGDLCHDYLPPGQEPSFICALPSHVLWWGALADVALFAGVPLALMYGFRWARARNRIRRHRCPHCGYSLQGASDPRCPECGRETTTVETTPISIE